MGTGKPADIGRSTHDALFVLAGILLGLLAIASLGCTGTAKSTTTIPEPPAEAQTQAEEITIIIALSNLPLGRVGHAGIAVGDQYWDYGPDRVERFQRLQAFGSPAGPWWDDPDQQWQADRTLDEVIDALPEHVHPEGSLVAILRVQVTPEEARAVRIHWNNIYEQMSNTEPTYRFGGRQCSNVVLQSLSGVGGVGTFKHPVSKLPLRLRIMTPTLTYRYLKGHLRNTAGPNLGEPAEVKLFRLKDNQLVSVRDQRA